MSKKSDITIGSLARETGTKVVTIRYYEKIGLLAAPQRTPANYRTYEPEHLDRLRFIRRCRDLGFTLDQIRELLRLSSDEDKDCAEVDHLAAAHLSAVEQKIADLSRLSEELQRIGRLCQGGGRIADCQIVEALSPSSGKNKSLSN